MHTQYTYIYLIVKQFKVSENCMQMLITKYKLFICNLGTEDKMAIK